FFDETRDVDVAAGAVAPLDVTLKERPGKLAIVARSGADVSIDGRFAAATPLPQPLDVEPGRHLVTVTQNGYRAFSQEIETRRAPRRARAAQRLLRDDGRGRRGGGRRRWAGLRGLPAPARRADLRPAAPRRHALLQHPGGLRRAGGRLPAEHHRPRRLPPRRR